MIELWFDSWKKSPNWNDWVFDFNCYCCFYYYSCDQQQRRWRSERKRQREMQDVQCNTSSCNCMQGRAATKEGSIDRSDNEPFSGIALSTQHVAVYTSQWNGLSRVLFAIPNAFYYTYAIYDQLVVNGRRRKIDRSIGRSTRASKQASTEAKWSACKLQQQRLRTASRARQLGCTLDVVVVVISIGLLPASDRVDLS